MTPGSARLWNGIACVGTLVLLACVLLLGSFPAAILPSAPASAFVELTSFLAFFAAVAVMMLPFDLIGGILIPTAFDTRPPGLLPWLMKWLRSVGVQLVIFSLTFSIYLGFGRAVGVWSLMVVFGIIQLMLLAGQELLWCVMSACRTATTRGGGPVFLRSTDDRFAGGIAGVPGCDTILMPDSWKLRLSASDLHLLIRRRQLAVATGGRLSGILLAMASNFLCFALAIVFAGGHIMSVADMITVYLWFMLFSFAGLLVLPFLNRRSVFALDHRIAMERSPEDLSRAIEAVDRLTERDPQRSASAESVFQPVPCPDRRRQALEEPGHGRFNVWNVARTALYLSWAGGGPLARAVHCNVGRPELWALLPVD